MNNTKRTICIALYAAVLYYLLPFSPSVLYYYSHHKRLISFDKLKKEHENVIAKKLADNNYYHHKTSHRSPKKNHDRYYFHPNAILEQEDNQIIGSNRQKLLSYFQLNYSQSRYFSLSGRGPPLV